MGDSAFRGTVVPVVAAGAFMIGVPIIIAANIPPTDYRQELVDLGFTNISTVNVEVDKGPVATVWVDGCQITLKREPGGQRIAPRWMSYSTAIQIGASRYESLSADAIRKNTFYFQQCVKTSPRSPSSSVVATPSS